MVHTYFGDRLRLIRKGLGMTQTRFAVAMGLPVWTIKDYEAQGVLPGYDNLYTLAKKLGLSVDFFFPPRAENDAGRLYPLTTCLVRARVLDQAIRKSVIASDLAPFVRKTRTA